MKIVAISASKVPADAANSLQAMKAVHAIAKLGHEVTLIVPENPEAPSGDKEWRSLLIKDSNKLVNSSVVKNPRITEPEILTISKSVVQNDEILRIICQNKEWVKNSSIRKALVLNNKTPLPVAIRFMGFLSEKDLAGMAKSKNISSVLVNNARRMLASRKKS